MLKAKLKVSKTGYSGTGFLKRKYKPGAVFHIVKLPAKRKSPAGFDVEEEGIGRIGIYDFNFYENEAEVIKSRTKHRYRQLGAAEMLKMFGR